MLNFYNLYAMNIKVLRIRHGLSGLSSILYCSQLSLEEAGLLRYSSMALAAFLPAPMARITVAAPVTASPPANTPLRLVRPFSSATIQPLRFVSRPLVVDLINGLGLVPSAMMTTSQSISKLLPSFTTGLRRPLSSGSPSSISTHSIPFTHPFSSPRTRTGLVSILNSIPSCLAWCTSSTRAGSSASLRR